ncbi:MAG: sensor histidine kinase, partial [Janthinobacterium lividum]
AETVDLAALVKHLRFDLATDLATPGATLAVEVVACPHVSFAPQHLRSIVYNLLSNALKYRHPTRPPVVELRCRRTNDAVVLEVEDNGLGLTEGQQSQLFGLFQRLHDHVPGTGIGLYMVKRLVENAGGTIAVQSQVGVGTTFTVTLPSTG